MLNGHHAFAQSRLGLTVGGNLNIVRLDYTNFDEPTAQFRPGFQFGVTSFTKLGPTLGLRSALLYTAKGYRVGDLRDDEFDKYMYNYFSLPLSLVVYSEDFHIGFGPYTALGLSGKNKYGRGNFRRDVNLTPSAGEVSASDFDDEAPFRRLDFGFNVIMGVDLNQVTIFFGYENSLSNLNVDMVDNSQLVFASNDFKSFHRTLSLGITYFPKR